MFRRLESNIAPTARRKLFTIISQDMASAVDKNFDTEGARLGRRWKRWTDRYKRRQTKRGRSKILQDSGQLKNEISTKATSNYAVVGSKKVYAPAHQLGIKMKHFKMPRRRFLAFNSKDIDLIEERVGNALVKGTK